MGDGETPPRAGTGTTATLEVDLPPEAGDQSEHERLRHEVDALRREVARLGLELQVERDRNLRLQEHLGSAESASGRLGSERRVVPAFDELGRRIGGAARGGWERLRGAVEPRPERAPAMAWSRLTLWEGVALAAILLVAVLARFWDVANLPEGFQGDEAAGGIVARQIQDDGWIGPYSPIAAGVPTGFFYVVALMMTLVADEVLAIRLVPALFGALTVAVLYLLVRRSFGVPAALASALVLATLGWHIHYSRISFPIIAWPFLVLVGLLALVEASRSEDWRWWAAAGGAFGLGLYTYNSHVILMALVALAVAVRLFGWSVVGVAGAIGLYAARPGFLALTLLAAALVVFLAETRVQHPRRLAQGLAFAGAFLLVGFSMIRYAADDANDYFGYGRRLSVLNTPEWEAKTGATDKAGYLADRYREYWDSICCHPRFDGVDATGVTAVIPLVTLLLAAVGMGFALRGRGRLAAAVGALLVLAMPWTSALSVDMAVRRSLVVTVFVAMFAGIGTVAAVRWAWTRGWAIRIPVVALVVLMASFSVYRNLDDFFGTTVRSPEMHWVLAGPMVEASRYLGALPPESYVYFYSERWPWTHEIRRFFAPDGRGEDRSEQFGQPGFKFDPANGRPVFIFFDSYRDDVAAVQARYPGGETIVAGDPANPDYVVYLPPVGDSGSTTTPSARPGATPFATPRVGAIGRG